MQLNNQYMQKLKYLKAYFVSLILLFISCSSTYAYSDAPIKNLQKHELFHNFSGDISAELAIVKQQKKAGLLLFFSTQHCPFCQRMKKTVLNQATVQQYFKSHFQMIEIDMESAKTLIDQQQQHISFKSYAKAHRVRLTPTIIFLDTSGDRLYQHSGIIANPTEFFWLGEYVTQGHTKRLSFAQFKTNKRKQTPR